MKNDVILPIYDNCQNPNIVSGERITKIIALAKRKKLLHDKTKGKNCIL